MSWIVSFYKIPSHTQTLAEIPDDFVPPPLGSGDEMLTLLREFFRDELIFDVALELVNRTCARTGWRAFDPEDGRLISPE
jgi:hypothetical protein